MDDEQVVKRVLQYEPHMRELEEQIDRLARFIIKDVPGEPSQSQGAVDTAIRIIGQLQEELQYWNENYKGEQYVLDLEAERDRLQREVDSLKTLLGRETRWRNEASNRVGELTAERDRLRKEVADWEALANNVEAENKRLREEYNTLVRQVRKWNEAVEAIIGRQPNTGIALEGTSDE